MPKVLVLDGGERSALAATRSLGAKGLHVIVGEVGAGSLAGASRFCSERVTYPSPFADPADFVERIAAECDRRRVEVLFPMTDISTYHVLKNRDRFCGTIIPCAPFESYETLSDKWKLFDAARELGLSMPHTVFVRSGADLRRHRGEVRFPTVIKPYRSRMWSNGRWIRASVRYAGSWTELEAIVARNECFAQHPFLLQEYIRGGWLQAAVALYDRGSPVVFFCHRRIRDKPPSGQVGTFAESIVHEPTRAMAEKLLTHAGWHGVAMVEFKVTRDGAPYLLEVNARFWAMVQLAIDSGVDFPWLLYQLATGRRPDTTNGYQSGVRLRWLLGDFAHLAMLVTRRGLNPYEPAAEHWRALSGFLGFFRPETHYEINRWGDLRPAVHELKRFLGKRVPTFGHRTGRRSSSPV